MTAGLNEIRGGVAEGVFPSVLETICHHAGSRIAMRSIGQGGRVEASLTYDELRARIDACAGAIGATTGDDDVVLLLEASAFAFVPWFLGALAAGRWALPAPANSTGPEIGRLVAESGARWVAGARAASVAAAHGLAVLEPCGASGRRRDGGGIILRTSGTTGIPKLVQRTMASLDAVASNVREATGLGPDDVVLAAIPAWHSYGVENAVLGPLAAGATVAFCDRFDVGVCEHLLQEGGVTVFPGVPMMFDALSRGPRRAGGASVRMAYSAGSSLSAETADAFANRWNRQVGQLYGATDVGSVTFNDPGSKAFLVGSVGAAMRGVSIRVLDHDGRDAPSSAEGQVAIRSPSMLSRYLGDQPLELVDGHLPMGDLGRLDTAGRLTITGMMKFLIDVGGMKVNPLEVESVLREHPSVGDCAVVPTRLSESVQRVRAIVTPAPGGASPDAGLLRAFARERLAGYKVPRVIDIRETLPRSSTGKLLRRNLEEV